MKQPVKEEIRIEYDEKNDKISEIETENTDFIYQEKLDKKIEGSVLSKGIGYRWFRLTGSLSVVSGGETTVGMSINVGNTNAKGTDFLVNVEHNSKAYRPSGYQIVPEGKIDAGVVKFNLVNGLNVIKINATVMFSNFNTYGGNFLSGSLFYNLKYKRK